MDADGPDRRRRRRRAVRAGADATCSPRCGAAGGGPEHLAIADHLHRRHGRLPGPRPRDRRRSGGGWPAPTTRPWPASASPGSGTTRRWSRCRGSPSCRDPDADRPQSWVACPHGHRTFPSFVLDCPDPGALATFYGALLDWKVDASSDWAEVRADDGQCICFQPVEDYRRPAGRARTCPSRCTST